MQSAEFATLLGELRAFEARLERIEKLLADAAALPPDIAPPLTVTAFAETTRLKTKRVRETIRARLIRVCRGGKPYRIPANEVGRFNSSEK